MVVRVVVGVAWSLVTGLAGGWLLMSPWALGEQGGGDWTTVTEAQFWTGAGLVALAVICLLIVASQVMNAVRDAGSVQPGAPRVRAAVAAASPEMDGALVALANALVADLNRQQASAPAAAPQYTPAAPPQYPAAPPPQYAPGQVPPGTTAPPPNGPPGTPAGPAPQAPPGAAETWRSRS
jgi:hypothetical protein